MGDTLSEIICKPETLEQVVRGGGMKETWSQRYKRHRDMLREGSTDDVRRLVEELHTLEREGRITASERRQLARAQGMLPPPTDEPQF
jgi:RNA polymerase-interacting CarD/CdnL/TRCF family regulator